jgi:prepilin-type N-terminal cleavage/methylation domain-containing protein/prepilin-type processing-associated H-X9-DG protein
MVGQVNIALSRGTVFEDEVCHPPKSLLFSIQGQNRMNKPRQMVAFTLIELLVVISIIALLVGILLPALGAARESARGLVCQTHVKNLSTAFVAYATDNSQWWPGWAKIGSNDLQNRVAGAWIPTGSLVSNAGTDPLNYANDITKGSLWQYTPDRNVFECPSDPFAHLSSGVSYTISHHIYRNLRPNFAGRTSMEPAVEVTIQGPPTVIMRYPQSDRFRSPSNLIFIVDEGGPAEDLVGTGPDIGVNDGYFQDLWSDLPGGNRGVADRTKWYHSDGAAFGFADGHGEIRKKSDEEVYKYRRGQMVGASQSRRFEYGRIWDPAAMAPTIAGQP